KITTRRLYGCQHCQRVGDPVLTRFRDGVAQPARAQLSGDQRSSMSYRNSVEQADIGVVRSAKGSDLGASTFRRRAKPGEMRIVCGDDRGAARLQPLENLGL